MWEEILIFFENTKNIWPLFVGCIAFLVYILQERRKVSEAASLIGPRLGSKRNSKGFPELLSHAVSRPPGHIDASRIAIRRASGSDDCSVSAHASPAG